MRPDHREVELEVGTERHLHHPVDRAERPDLIRRPGRAVVHHQVRARLLGQRRLVGAAHGGDDTRPGPFGQFDGEVADRARSAGDQHRLPGHRTVGEQAVMRGHGRNAQRGTQLERGAVRQ